MSEKFKCLYIRNAQHFLRNLVVQLKLFKTIWESKDQLGFSKLFTCPALGDIKKKKQTHKMPIKLLQCQVTFTNLA